MKSFETVYPQPFPTLTSVFSSVLQKVEPFTEDLVTDIARVLGGGGSGGGGGAAGGDS